jgi:metallo-beta-lactamase family protein
MATLTFLGAAGTVTGSKHLLDIGGRLILVDCGLFQGLKELRLRNWAAFPIDPTRIHAIVLTHAHLDHCGYLPRLVAQGFGGRVFCTPGTRDLCTLVLADAARLQEEDAHHANRHGYSKHHPAEPLYTQIDAARALDRLQPVGYERPTPVAPGVEVEFLNAGHLLGSAFARVTVGTHSILFGGDLGRYGRPVLPDPVSVDAADVLLLESTYGDRLHEPDDAGKQLAAIVRETITGGGRVIVPSFAIGRVEEVLYWLKLLEESRQIPRVPIYLDSPMAIAALQFYTSRIAELDPDLTSDPRDRRMFWTAHMSTVQSAQQSKELVASGTPGIVIASSGMATGGRVLHHLEAALPDPRNTVLFVGYQALGTRGRLLVDGAKQVKMHGRLIGVGARIEQLDSMSAHADVNEIVRWLSGFERAPAMTYLVHGEQPALDALKTRIETTYRWPVHVAEHLEKVELPLGVVTAR